MKKIFLILWVILIFNYNSVFGAETEQLSGIEEQLEMFDFEEIDTAAGIDFKEIILKAIKGELDLSPSNIINSGMKLIFSELFTYNYLIKNLIIISLLSAVLRILTDSFKHKEVGELGYYVTYIVLIIIIFNSMRVGIDIMLELVAYSSNVMNALIPLAMSLLIMSGYISSAAAFNTVLFFSVNFISRIIEFLLAPLITLLAILQTVNYLSEKDMLNSLTERAARGLAFFLKAVGILFIAILSIQRISTPLINNLFLKTAKISVNAVPVVGTVLSGAVDTVAYFTKTMRSGFMVAGILALIIISLVPLIKISILVLTYNIIAALLEPICEERLVKAISGAGKLMVLVLGASFIVVLMFIFYLIIVLSL